MGSRHLERAKRVCLPFSAVELGEELDSNCGFWSSICCCCYFNFRPLDFVRGRASGQHILGIGRARVHCKCLCCTASSTMQLAFFGDDKLCFHCAVSARHCELHHSCCRRPDPAL